MKVNVEFEAAILQPLLVRCQQEGVLLDACVNAWMRRALRQDKTLMPTVETRAKVVNLPLSRA